MPATLVPPEIMATIRARKKADGTVGYTVQICLKKKGVLVYQEDRTFARRQAAQRWAKRRETELARAAWGYEIDAQAMPDARLVLKKFGYNLKRHGLNRHSLVEGMQDERDRGPALPRLASRRGESVV